MRTTGVLVVVVCAAACGSVSNLPDASSSQIDAPGQVIDSTGAPIDACEDRVLFDGGVPSDVQGWALSASGDYLVQPDPAAGTTRIQTSTSPIGIGGHALLSLANAVPVDEPFTIEWEVLVLDVNIHNQFDAAVVFMGSYGGGLGTPLDREQMFFIDRDRIGWADDTQFMPVNSLDMAFHTYRFSVDANRRATMMREDGVGVSRASFSTNGTIAMGDQTNDAGVEGHMVFRRVTRIGCP